ncbi:MULTISPECIES: hypothetical protein [Niastella]|uniref:CDI immunity protein domain-containing protein n=1 Tax=Niastella soli TaxID=2821487 RepID=A0ABS3YZ61_9BACT|nr:hypothetical protein [Niastella soli]MBO9202436.1 hypothetical protein [Niastella soli]
MELTGEMYGFYSNRELPVVFEELKKFAESIGYKFNIHTFHEWENIFFYKDEQMLQYHDEKGYNTALNGEGCFGIEAKKNTKLIGIATLFEFEGDSNFDPHDINLVLNHVNYYLLVIPDIIEEDEFSKKIHNAVRSILLSE